MSEIEVALENQKDAINRIEVYVDLLKELKDIGQKTVKREQISLRDFCNQIEQQYKILAKRNQKNVVVTWSGNPSVYMDKLLVSVVLDRVVENAVRFAEKWITIDCKGEIDGIEIAISNDGVPFDAEVLKHGTEAFFTTDKARGHIGIGLQMATRLVEKMEGQLVLSNENDKAAVQINLKNSICSAS